jgi:hypothetical protein
LAAVAIVVSSPPSPSSPFESEDFDRFSDSDVCHLFLHPIAL